MKRIIALLSALAMVLSMGVFCVAETGGAGETQAEFPFADVPAARWSNPYVVMMYNEGIVGGVSANLFAPADNVTRAQFVKILCGVAGADLDDLTHDFTDVKTGSWYEPYVAWAASRGIVNGVAPGKFAPDAKITRQDMSVMIYRYVENVLFAEPELPPLPPEPITPTAPTYILPTETTPPPVIMSDEPPMVVIPTIPEGSEEPEAPAGLPVVNPPVTFTDDEKIADYAKEAVGAMQQAGIIGGVGNPDGTFRFEPKNNATREQACKMLGELFLIINEDKTLPEAVAPSAYLITYDLQGGKASWLKQVYTSKESFVLPTPTKEGYTFDGWSGTGIKGKQKTVTVPTGTTGDLKFKANFTPIKYTITYDYNGGAGNSSAPKSYTVESKTLTISAPKRDGYEFLGWTGTGLSSPTKNLSIKKGSTGNRSYKANWKALSKQATALDLLADWVDDNYNYYFDGDNTVVFTGEYEGVEEVLGVIHRPLTYADPMRRVQLEYSSISSGICFTSIITLGTKGTPTVLCEVTDAATGDVYMRSSEMPLSKISEDMTLNIYWKYNYLGNDPELLSTVKTVMLMQIVGSKATVNDIYRNEIGRYGYDLSVFGL